MILKHTDDVPAEEIKKEGVSGLHARFLLTADDGCPRYAIRLMEFAPGGHSPWHRHKEEHEVYILEGEGVLVGDDKEQIPVRAGDAIYVLPCENHMFMNTGEGMMKMICTVPIFSGMTGKDTTPCDE